MAGKKKGGLEGVVAAASSITEVDGEQGKLSYRGIDIRELAGNSTFEETAHLLWHGELPTSMQLRGLEARLAAARELPWDIHLMIVEYMLRWDPMGALRTSLSALSAYDPEISNLSPERNLARAIELSARTPVILATHHLARRGLDPIAPRPGMGAAANFLYMLRGTEPSEQEATILDVALILHADHELNASTFAARVAASTLADIYCAVTAAIGTLAGPLHGGANEQVMAMLQKIEKPSRAEQFVLDQLARGRRIPGFGHRVYKGEDPRATVLREKMAELAGKGRGGSWYETAKRVEEVMMRERGLNANLDFFSGMVYSALGISADLFTPIFAAGRMAGWTAHILEQYGDNRLIRPVSEYVGPTEVHYVPMSGRRMAA